jgi:NAD(P)-dependent dehydrogenase (short-subunit alcohol dehydrogenase family)
MSGTSAATNSEERTSPTAPATDPLLRRGAMPGLSGKNVLVTGGTSGIGQATAVRFAEQGANVAINYLTTPDEAAETEEQVHACLRKIHRHGVRDVLVRAEVSHEQDLLRMVEVADCAWSRWRPRGSAA